MNVLYCNSAEQHVSLRKVKEGEKTATYLVPS